MQKSKLQSDIRAQLVLICALFLIMFHFTSAIWVKPNSTLFKYVHLGMMMIIVIMRRPFLKGKPDNPVCLIDFAETIFILFSCWYVGHDVSAFSLRAGNISESDVIIGTIFLLILVDAGRRTVGWIMIGLASFFAVQNVISDHLFSIFKGPSISWKLLVDCLWVRPDGVFSSPVNTISSYVIFFMVFAAVLNASGAGKFFIELAQAVAGRSRGGPAKTAVIASGCFGSISGSPISNVAGTGAITIPMMKKMGYSSAFAGAVEAVASTGGAIMPPLMGSSTFIIAATLSMSYGNVILCALIPALLYYIALFFMVDYRAAKLKLEPLKADEVPNLKETWKKGGQLVFPLILIVVLLLMGFSAQFSAMVSTLVLIMITYTRSWTRMDGAQLTNAVIKGALDTSKVAVVAGIAGIIIGGVSLSGLALVFAQSIVKFNHGQLWLTLILVAIAALVLGMGMTSAAVYITVATLMAPTLTKMGVLPIAAHMFVFYYGVIGTITPPVAMTAYTAAGLADASPSKTGWIAFRLGAAGYIVPFMFVYGPSLLMQGGPVEIIISFITAVIGVWALASALEGWVFTKASVIERLLLGTAALLMIDTRTITDLAGIAVIALVVLFQWFKKKQTASPAA
ncbi:TRAP transporter fused permease subunit [Oscillospiraceae bacterium 44-5]